MTSRTGVGNYVARLVEHIAAEYPDDVQLVGYYYNFLGRKSPPTTPKAANIHYKPILFLPGPIVNLLRRFHIEVPIEMLVWTRADFIIYPNYLGHPSLFRTPNAPVIHDLVYLDFPEYGSSKSVKDLTDFVPKSLRRASFILTVSEFSKQRIIEKYQVAADKIVTTFIPPSEPIPVSDSEAQQSLTKQGITKPYLFFIGTMEPRKNIPNLLEAYKLLPQPLRDKYSLVLAGKIDWKYESTKSKIESTQSEGYDVHYLGFIDDATRSALYQSSSLLVWPSSYEGFGMPILEALSYGVPCAVSDIPVFHEVGQDAVTYFDQSDPAAIATAIVESLETQHNSEQLKSYVESRPSWADVSRKVVDRIRKTLNKDSSE
jgi:glycosyltransferase involved in cell wall biosynthesis